MPLEKLKDKIKKTHLIFGDKKHYGPCLYPEHNPPMHMVLEPGKYKHTCPQCGKQTIFEVPHITTGGSDGKQI